MTSCDAGGTGQEERPGALGGRDVAVLVIGGPIARADVPGLCGRARRLLAGGAPVLVCDVTRITEPDLCTVDALAHLQLTAARLGRPLSLRGTPGELGALLAVTGFADLFPPCPRQRGRPATDGPAGTG